MTVPVFDVGGVLLDWSPYYLTDQMGYPREEAERVLTEIGFDDWNLALDAGGRWGPAVEELATRFPHHKELIFAFNDRWPEMVGGEITGTVAILKVLQAAGPVYAITNFSEEKFNDARSIYPYLAQFTGTIVSGEEAMVKPDLAIYRCLLDRFDLVAGDCLFIDDKSYNVEAARTVGMKAVQFTGPDQLREDLNAYGITVAL